VLSQGTCQVNKSFVNKSRRNSSKDSVGSLRPSRRGISNLRCSYCSLKFDRTTSFRSQPLTNFGTDSKKIMKQFITAITLTLLFIPAVFAREQTVLARVTVYWASRDSQQQRAAYNGARLRPGHCAVDPDRIPYGSKVIFSDGAECKAIDTGPAVVSRQAARLSGRNVAQRDAIVVDRYFETKEEALAWADMHPHFMTLQVVTPGSKKRPLPEHGTMLAQIKATSNTTAETIVAVQASPGLQTLDASALALLPLIPLWWAVRRRIVRLGLPLRFA
jgi:hypothetical protein